MTQVRLFLCTELDHTLLPNGPQPEPPGARSLFDHLTQQPGVALAYVTGRHRALVDQAIANYRLPQPDFAITDSGTKIHAWNQGAWRAWRDWEEEIKTDWAGHTHESIKQLFSDLKPLRLQELTRQNTHKLSYYIPVQEDWQSLQEEMQRRLHKRGICASLVWSVDETAGLGFLDLLPERATKLHAVEFLRRHLGFPLEYTLFAGDNGNDMPLIASAVPSVLVANATNGMREAALSVARASDHEDALYLAHGGFLGMDGNYSAGILEGVAHFQTALADWLAQEQG